MSTLDSRWKLDSTKLICSGLLQNAILNNMIMNPRVSPECVCHNDDENYYTGLKSLPFMNAAVQSLR